MEKWKTLEFWKNGTLKNGKKCKLLNFGEKMEN